MSEVAWAPLEDGRWAKIVLLEDDGLVRDHNGELVGDDGRDDGSWEWWFHSLPRTPLEESAA